jgi:anti-sigma regulatory factor (Ser/Thr protein kinase)
VVFKEAPDQSVGVGQAGDRHVSASFPADPGELARARDLVRAALGAWDLGDHEGPVQLAASELVTNALMHGEGEEVEVALGHRDGLLRLEVTDGGGSGVPAVRTPGEGGLGGWGLRIVEQVADEWGTESDDDGRTTVWMTRTAPHPAA